MHYFKMGPAKRVIGAAIVAALGAGAACANILGIDSDRHLPTTSGNDAGGPSTTGPWDCLGNPSQNPNPSENIALSIQVNNASSTTINASQIDGGSSLVAVTRTALPDVQVKECPNLADPGCMDSTAETVTTDDAGMATFNLNGAFQGFFILSRADLVPYTYYPGNPLLNVSSETIPIGVLTESAIQGVAAVLPTENTAPSIPPPDAGPATEGMIFFGVYDCNDVYAPGVQVSLSNPTNDTFEYYATTGDFLSTMASYTTAVAAGGFINVPPGSSTVTARIYTGTLAGTVIGTATVPVKAGAVAQVNFRTRTH